MENEKSVENYCELIAWLINCDNLQFKFTNKIFTKNSIWNYNSHGELFGLYSAIDFIDTVLKDKILPERLENIINKKLNNENIETIKENSSAIGLKIMTLLYQTGEEFEKFADTMFNFWIYMKYELKKESNLSTSVE